MEFHLAGGAALAPRIGHRRSADLRLFTEDCLLEGVRRSLERELGSYPLETLEGPDGNLLSCCRCRVSGPASLAICSRRSSLVIEWPACPGPGSPTWLDEIGWLIGRGSRIDFCDRFHVPPLVSIERL